MHLRANVANPALGGADRLLFMSTDQLGAARPQPGDSNADAGAAESAFAHSTVSSANNDTLTGTGAANVINGLAGHDFIKGLAGADTLSGGEGGDFLVAELARSLNGNSGIDLVGYAATVTPSMSTRVATGRRALAALPVARETDARTGIEGAIGSAVTTGSLATIRLTGSRAVVARTPALAGPGATSTTTTSSQRALLAPAAT